MIMAFDLVVGISLNSDEKICDRGVNVLKNNSKISGPTKTDVFQLNLSEMNGKLGKKGCRSCFQSIWYPLTR